MINPLLHPNSSSAPTSPVCTRSAISGPGIYQPGFPAPGIRIMRKVPQKLRDMSPVRIIPGIPGLPGIPGTSPQMREHQAARGTSSRQRRLSRAVKCRTMDFTEFPEGMIDYRNRTGAGKIPLREIKSQPGSPVIPRIEIHDFGSEVSPTLVLMKEKTSTMEKLVSTL